MTNCTLPLIGCHRMLGIIITFNWSACTHGKALLQYNQQYAPVSQIIYSCKMLYMFWTVFPSIIRSSKLHILQQTYVQLWAPDDGRKDRLKHVEHFTRINNLRNRCILLVVLQEYILMHGPMNVKWKGTLQNATRNTFYTFRRQVNMTK